MQNRPTSTRREAIGIATLAVSMVIIANDASAAISSQMAPVKIPAARPTREDLARAARLYAGEFGGGVGVR
jgi:hypothetical protein